MIECLECKTKNPPQAANCRNCGAELRPARVASYLAQAASNTESGQYEAAGAALNRADVEMLALSAEQRAQYLFTGRAFLLQAMIYFGKGLLDEAKSELLLAQQNLEGLPNSGTLLADVFNRLGRLCYYENDFTQAINYFLAGGEAASKAGAHDVASKAMANLGLVYSESGQISEATAMLARSLVEAELSASDRAIADTNRLLASVYADYGPYSLALKYAARAAEVASRLSDVEMRCLATVEAARVYLRAGEVERGRDYMHEAYDISRRSGSKLAREAVENYLAEFVREDGRLPDWFKGATFNELTALSEPLLLANNALRLGYYSIGEDDNTARRYLRWVKEQMKDSTKFDSGDAAGLEHAEALLYSRLGEPDKAQVHFEEALSKTTRPYEQAMLKEEYGRMLLDKAATPEARAKAQELLAEATALYQQLELPYRVEQLAALLA